LHRRCPAPDAASGEKLRRALRGGGNRSVMDHPRRLAGGQVLLVELAICPHLPWRRAARRSRAAVRSGTFQGAEEAVDPGLYCADDCGENFLHA